jgi:hypothetical protein
MEYFLIALILIGMGIVYRNFSKTMTDKTPDIRPQVSVVFNVSQSEK